MGEDSQCFSSKACGRSHAKKQHRRVTCPYFTMPGGCWRGDECWNEHNVAALGGDTSVPMEVDGDRGNGWRNVSRKIRKERWDTARPSNSSTNSDKNGQEKEVKKEDDRK